MTQAHLDPNMIAAYAERRLPHSERATVEAHLAGCGDCRREVTSVALLIRASERRRTWLVASTVAAAAAVLVMALVTNPFARRTVPETIRPGDDGRREGVTTLVAHSPADGAVVARANLRFAWQRIATDALYHFTLADGSGAPLWQMTTTDTALAVPAGLTLPPGGRYLWYVDVLLPDARKATSGVRELILGR